MCAVLPAIHNLTGSNTCSKIGTKKPPINKDNPTDYLKEFGRDLANFQESAFKAEEYLVKVISLTTSFITMDELRFYRFHHSKNMKIVDLPPTSFSLKGHLLRAYFYATYMTINVLSDPYLDPL